MSSKGNTLLNALLRFIIVTGLIIAAGYVVYRNAVFIRTMWPYQFFLTGITVGVAYMAFKSTSRNNGFLILLIWFFLVLSNILLIGREALHSWHIILRSIYVISMTCAIYLYVRSLGKSLMSTVIKRIMAATIIIAVINGVIVIILGILSSGRPSEMLQAIYHNIAIGGQIGILTGIGIEIAEYVIGVLTGTQLKGTKSSE